MLKLNEKITQNIMSVKPLSLFKIRKENDSCYVIYNKKTCVHLNSTAGVIYEYCDGNRSIYEILELLKEQYDVDVENLKRDLIWQLRVFQRSELISIRI
jgi:hypothetical protein